VYPLTIPSPSRSIGADMRTASPEKLWYPACATCASHDPASRGPDLSPPTTSSTATASFSCPPAHSSPASPLTPPPPRQILHDPPLPDSRRIHQTAHLLLPNLRPRHRRARPPPPHRSSSLQLSSRRRTPLGNGPASGSRALEAAAECG